MPTYIYKARDEGGRAVKGTMEADTKEALIDKLKKMGYMATQVKEALPSIKMESVFETLKRIRPEDMIIFNIQLSNMISAGINILASLRVLARQLDNRKLRESVDTISRSVEAGDSFSEAVSRHPRVFSKLFVNMVKAGEESGKLDMVLARYAQFSERQEELRQKIKGALFYPAILLFAGIAVTLFVITFVIPQFAEIFIKAGIKLPAVTSALYEIGTAIKGFWYIILLLPALIWVAMRYYAKTSSGRLRIDSFKLKMPILSPLYRKAAISRFARTLGTLSSSGVPILQALDITKDVAGNEVIAGIVGNVRTSVEKGQSISGPLKISEEFPPDAVQMISVGEETGNLDGMLSKVADFYDRSLGYTVKKLTTLLEPLLLVMMSCMVGFIMASLLLPMFDMIKVLRH